METVSKFLLQLSKSVSFSLAISDSPFLPLRSQLPAPNYFPQLTSSLISSSVTLFLSTQRLLGVSCFPCESFFSCYLSCHFFFFFSSCVVTPALFEHFPLEILYLVDCSVTDFISLRLLPSLSFRFCFMAIVTKDLVDVVTA